MSADGGIHEAGKAVVAVVLIGVILAFLYAEFPSIQDWVNKNFLLAALILMLPSGYIIYSKFADNW